MADVFTPEERSRVMRQVHGRDTSPELAVRAVAHARGYRYRLHRANLPGKPDLAFPSRRGVVFVHGCWWHGHDCRAGVKRAKGNADYWAQKLQRNRARDKLQLASLRRLGWRTLVIWECETRDPDVVASKLLRFLGPPGAS